MQCGTCGGSCPSAADMDHTPRLLFAMIRAGLRDEVLRSNTPWMCVSCYFCAVRCPQEDPHPGRDVRAQVDRHARGPSPRTDGARLLADVRREHPRATGAATRSASWRATTCATIPLRLPGMAPMGIGCRAAAGWASCPTASSDVDGPARDPRPRRRELETPEARMTRATSTTRAARWTAAPRPTRRRWPRSLAPLGHRPGRDRRLELLRRDRVPDAQPAARPRAGRAATSRSPSAAQTARRPSSRRAAPATSTSPRPTTTCATTAALARPRSTRPSAPAA